MTMELNNRHLCDFCFEPINSGDICPNCGLTHETYKPTLGLLLPGTNLLGKYIIGRVLGQGGFGATYLAYSSERGEPVAIKEYFPINIATRSKGEEKVFVVSEEKNSVFIKGEKRFFEEAKTMSRFNQNKNVVSVYEFFYANNTVYYSMEYLKGIDLKNYIIKKGGRLNESEVVTIMRGICEALIAVHSTLTLHRDISPDNIFICTNGDVKLIDFGAAKQVISGEQQVYSVVVKQGFAPPEQYSSRGKQGTWTDIYSVGASMYYAITGKVPPDAMNRVENPEIVFDPSLNISPQFAAIIRKCLHSKIDERYQNAIELMGALNGLNTQNVFVGGNNFQNDVYKGVTEYTGVQQSVIFTSGSGNGGYQQHSQMPPPYISTYYPPSGYPMSQYADKYGEDREKSGLYKGLIIGGCAFAAVVLIIILVLLLSGPGGPPPPPQGGMPPM